MKNCRIQTCAPDFKLNGILNDCALTKFRKTLIGEDYLSEWHITLCNKFENDNQKDMKIISTVIGLEFLLIKKLYDNQWYYYI